MTRLQVLFGRFVRTARGTPVRRALFSALIYLLMCGAYIVFSSWLAARTSPTTRHMEIIETVKGLAFVGATAVLLFFLSLAWWQRLRRQEELLIQGERRTVMNLYTAVLVHDLNNLLMTLSGTADRIREREQGDEFLRLLRTHLEQGLEKISQLTKRLAMSGKEISLNHLEAVNLPAAVARTVQLVRKHPDLRGRTLAVSGIPPLVLQLNPELFDHALMNLILNAAQAGGFGAQIIVAAVRASDTVVLEVHDNGPGVPPDKLECIFEPGFTTKAAGTGLGLLSVQAFATSCNARISVDRSHLGGACFRLHLPVPGTAPEP